MSRILLECTDYRQVLREAYGELKTSKSHLSLSLLAKKIGCSSKSYPREVMTGRRSLTMNYAPAFAQAFGLKGDTKRAFLKMVEIERPECADRKSRLQIEIDRIRRRAREKTDDVSQVPSARFRRGVWIDVYAATGNPERGATLLEIKTRTGFPAPFVQEIVTEMLENKILESKEGRLFPCKLHYFFESADQDQVFKERFLDVLNRIRTKSTVSMKSPENLFLCSTISVNSVNFPRFKEELRELVNEFVEDAEDAAGDKLSHILVGMIS